MINNIRKLSLVLFSLIPLFLITGPAIPDLVITLGVTFAIIWILIIEKNYELFNSIRKNFNTCKISLAVGLGTFKPLSDDPITELTTLHDEDFFISDDAAQLINKQMQNNKRIIAIGTTTLRALEAAWCNKDRIVISGKSTTNIFIKEGYKFNVVNSLVTNFHLPQSSLLMLVSAFSGKEFILSAYKHAIDKQLRFFSYGDAMIIER